MKNSERPINPLMELDYQESSIQQRIVFQGQEYGLTKREHFASLAMQSLISLSDNVELDYLKIVKTVSKASVIFADALLKELEK